IHSIKLLENFVKDHPSGKDLKRALAVKLSLENYSYRDIQKILEVS
ncbi:MAG: IS630 family transposase, partial [Cyanobacteria bacterium QH_6_48_35]